MFEKEKETAIEENILELSKQTTIDYKLLNNKKELPKIIEMTKTIKRLDLSNSSLSKDLKMRVWKALELNENTLTEIKLQNSKLSDEDMLQICYSLRINNSIKSLDLSKNNKLSFLSGILLGNILSTNNNLIEIHLDDNGEKILNFHASKLKSKVKAFISQIDLHQQISNQNKRFLLIGM